MKKLKVSKIDLDDLLMTSPRSSEDGDDINPTNTAAGRNISGLSFFVLLYVWYEINSVDFLWLLSLFHNNTVLTFLKLISNRHGHY